MNKRYDFEYRPKRSHRKKTMIFFVFLLVIILILFTTFYRSGFSITGRIIQQSNENKSLTISTTLPIPELNLKGDYERIIISGKSDSYLTIGSQEISLKDTERNEIIIEDFSGRIEFDKEKISILNGRAEKVIINKMPITSQGIRKMKFSSHSEIFYESIEFKEKLNIKEINYFTSGNILIDYQNNLLLNNDELLIKNYFGNLQIRNNQMHINGLFESLEITGNNKKILISFKG